MLIPTQQILADERAKKGKCYITTGYVNNKLLAPAAAKELLINFDDFELFERSDKKVYLTIGKTEQKLFNKLKSDKKTYNFNCSQGKGFQKRFSFDKNFNLVSGRKKFIDFESDYFSVIAPIKAEEKRLVDLEVQRQVEARMEAIRLADIKKQEEEIAAQKEKLRLLEIARKKQAEIDRLAAQEKARQAEIDRLAEQEQARQAEIDRLAAQEKVKKDYVNEDVVISNNLGFCIGFLGRLQGLLEKDAENNPSVKLVVDDMANVNMALILKQALTGARLKEIRNKEGFEFANKYMGINALQEVMDSESIGSKQINSCVKLL